MPDVSEIQPDVDAAPAPAAAVPEETLIAPVLEPELTPTPDARVHPLSPGGQRFEQIYAQHKQTQRALDDERERRIAAEAKLELLAKPQAQAIPDVEYSWSQLEDFIQQGRITRADAETHREDVRVRKLRNELKAEFQKDNSAAMRAEALTKGIFGYMQAVPTLTDRESPDRARLDEEFDWLASVQGVDANKLSTVDRKALELTALRNVYGSLDALVKRTMSSVAETHQGLPGGTPPKKTANPDQVLINALTPREVAHYQAQMARGRYPGGWKEVVAELKFVKPRYV